jgi:predicted phage terminase large subunit-like protein
MNFSDAALLEYLAILESRESFYAFRRFLHQKLRTNWFVKDMSQHLQLFYEEFVKGNRPKLAICSPPQHGKSSAVVDFIAWVSGKDPSLRSIFASFSKRLGVRANLSLQRIYASPRYQLIFPNTRINTVGLPDTFGATRNREIIEFVGTTGSFRNTTVRGSINGESLDLAVIDDPVKGREAANSKANRESTWDWFTNDFLTRFDDKAAMLFVMTRWHLDDPLGRLMENKDAIKVVSYPAIAVEDETFRKKGEPLFPELKSLDFLKGISKILSLAYWEALYQQNPRVMEGKIINDTLFRLYSGVPSVRLTERKIFADTAQKTNEANDYSVFQCWGIGEDGNLYLLDQLRGKWEAPELEVNAFLFWEKHKAVPSYEFGRLTSMEVEDKSSGTGLIQGLKKKINIHGIKRTIDKYTRVLDILGPLEHGRLWVPNDRPWVSDFLTECREFTSDDSHAHDDQIDPICDAVNTFITKRSDLAVWKILGTSQ